MTHGPTAAVASMLPDRIALPAPHAVRLGGYLGGRVTANEAHLEAVDLDPLLAGFRSRPGSHPWIGEHIGKWLDAASLAWDHTRDPALRDRLETAVRALLATQGPDGYLGTYPPDVRFGMHAGADWDVWVHGYVLTGLLAWYRVSGDEAALDACRRLADLLDRTFRTGPSPRRIIDAGWHVGMAATSVLGPLVELYRATGVERYLLLASSVVESWDLPGGPRILSALRETGRVTEVGNGKAYEMLVNMVGLVELARTTGDRGYLDAVVSGWQDIVARHRYVTGGASVAEHFQRRPDLPNAMAPNVAETCVTVTWLQLNRELLRSLGEARFGAEIERVVYNHLLAAQHPDGRTWCYYTALEGTRPYGPGVSCCVSSGPRGVALLPTLATGVAGSHVVVDLWEPSESRLVVDGSPVQVVVRSPVPAVGDASIEVASVAPVGLRLRVPAWAHGFRVRGAVDGVAPADGWLEVAPRSWSPGDAIHVDVAARPARVVGTHANEGKVALTYGPLVLAYATDEERGGRTPAFDVLGAGEPSVDAPGATGPVALTTTIDNRLDGLVAHEVTFRPFAEAGADGRAYRTWIATREPDIPVSLLGRGAVSRSSGSIPHGSAIDYEPSSFVSTWDGREHGESWVAVSVEEPVLVRRIVVGHGWSWVNGGWFDTSEGEPVVEVRTQAGGPWRRVGELAGHPATTASDPGGLVGGETFELMLPAPMSVVAVRVRGRGSFGDYPPARYVTVSLLAAYAV